MNELAHAKLSASGAHRWIPCPGSVSLEEGLPDTPSEFAEHGTAGHTLAQMSLENECSALTYKGMWLNKSDAFPDGFLVDDDMVDAVQQYLDYCNGLEGQHQFVEYRVDFSNWVPEGFGTSDFIKLDKNDEGQIIHCVDLKMGKGVKVFAKDNPQGMLYALGVLNTMDMAFEFNDFDLVDIVIVQPRLDHIDEWMTTIGALKKWAKSVASPAANKAWAGDLTFQPGDKQCKFCKAKSTCKALADHSIEAVSKIFQPLPEEIDFKEAHSLTNEEIGKLIPLTDGIIDWCKALQSYAFNLMEGGTTIPGYKLVRGRAGHRKWVDEEQVSMILSENHLGMEDMFQLPKLLTPPNMVKLLKVNGLSVDLISNLWVQPEGKRTMATNSDSRDELAPEIQAEFRSIEP
jgi:hypothetical protein